MKFKLFLMLFSSLLFVSSLQLDAFGDSGKDLFISKCGQCHKTGGIAPVFAPTKYATAQWKRFFERNKHARKKDISNVINQSEMDRIKLYLMRHAADTSQPEASGLR